MINEKYIKLAKEYDPCIVVTPKKEYHMGKYRYYGLTVVAESEECIGHSHGVGSRYDYGFTQIDTENGINVFIVT